MMVDLFVIKCAVKGYEEVKSFHERIAEVTPYDEVRKTEMAQANALKFAIEMLEALIPELKSVPSEAPATSVA